MAAVLTEPEAAKAATTTAGDDQMVYMSLPITKAEDTKTVNPVDGTPDIEILGKVDRRNGRSVTFRWSIRTPACAGSSGGMSDGKANVRMQHDPKRPVGKGLHVDGHHVRALIADPTAKHVHPHGRAERLRPSAS